MDIQALEAEMAELQRRYKEWHDPIYKVRTSLEYMIHSKDPRAEEAAGAYNDYVDEQLAIYHPPQAAVPVREKLLSMYLAATAGERRAIRAAVAKLWYMENVLYRYVLNCAECLESPDDGDILFSGLVALSIENCAHDFRDFGHIRAELAIAAREAGIDMVPHAKAVAALCDDRPTPGGCYPSVRDRIEEFPVYAQTAVHLLDVSDD